MLAVSSARTMKFHTCDGDDHLPLTTPRNTSLDTSTTSASGFKKPYAELSSRTPTLPAARQRLHLADSVDASLAAPSTVAFERRLNLSDSQLNKPLLRPRVGVIAAVSEPALLFVAEAASRLCTPTSAPQRGVASGSMANSFVAL